MGQYEYVLKSLADDQLLLGLARVVLRRNEITAEFLAYLAELDERQLFLDLGFSSLFEYCTVKLGLCESTAGRHIAAARVCRSHPQVFAMVASGVLHASALSLMRKRLTPENAGELFGLCSRQSARKVEELLAARFPRPDVRDLVRRLPSRRRPTLDVERSTEPFATRASSCEPLPQTLLSEAAPSIELENASVESTVREPPTDQSKAPVESRLQTPSVALDSPEAPKPRRFEPLSAGRYGVHFTANGEFCELLERVRGLAGHRLPSGDLMTLLQRGLEAYERELEKERFAVGRKTRRIREVTPASGTRDTSELSSKSEPASSGLSSSDVRRPAVSTTDPSKPARPPNRLINPKRKRRYSAAVVRAVFLRDGKQCSFVASDGQRCSARRCLELDHIEPFAVGGADTIENLRLRCRSHNQRYARQYFGVSRVGVAIGSARRQRETQRGELDASGSYEANGKAQKAKRQSSESKRRPRGDSRT